jgi:hypothetical protein
MFFFVWWCSLSQESCCLTFTQLLYQEWSLLVKTLFRKILFFDPTCHVVERGLKVSEGNFSQTSVYLFWRRNGENRQLREESRHLIVILYILYSSVLLFHY